MCVYSVTLMDVGVIYILTGCNREVLSSFLQSMHPKKPRDSPSEVSRMWKCIWSKWRSVCKDIEELQRNSVVVVSNLASTKPQPLCSCWFFRNRKGILNLNQNKNRQENIHASLPTRMPCPMCIGTSGDLNLLTGFQFSII